MSMAKITLDESETSVVVTCDECPFWYAFTWTKLEAYASAASHQIRVHDVEEHRAAEPGRLWKLRHAAPA